MYLAQPSESGKPSGTSAQTSLLADSNVFNVAADELKDYTLCMLALERLLPGVTDSQEALPVIPAVGAPPSLAARVDGRLVVVVLQDAHQLSYTGKQNGWAVLKDSLISADTSTRDQAYQVVRFSKENLDSVVRGSVEDQTNALRALLREKLAEAA